MGIRIAVSICFLLTSLPIIAQDGRIIRETFYSPSLEGNLFGDSPYRAVTIYLPPSYDTEPDMLYPVVYLLHGYSGNHNLWTIGSYGNILLSMKSWLESDQVKEMILVMPNSYNRFRGSCYINSIATGNWADYIAKDLVEHIDSHYRTLPQRESRAVIGHSMGGYGGMNLGLDYPDVFGCMGSMAGLLDITQWPATLSSAYARAAELENLSDFDSQTYPVTSAIAISAAMAPNPENPPFYADFPWEYDSSGKLVQNQAVWDRFLAHDVLRRLSPNVESLRCMPSIYFACGIYDSYKFFIDARRVHQELQRLGIPHYYHEFVGGHISYLMDRTGDALEAFSNALAFEMLVDVEFAGKLVSTWSRIKRQYTIYPGNDANR